MNHHSPTQDACLQCNSPDVEPGFKVSLCKPCRTRFSSYPVSKKIKCGGVILGLVVLFSFFRCMWDIKAAFYYEKGLVHFNDREYTYAQQAFVKTNRIYRNHTGSIVHLFTARYYSTTPAESLQSSLDKLTNHTAWQKNPALYEEALTIQNMIIRDRAQSKNMDTAMKLYIAQQIPRADSIFQTIMQACPGYLPPCIMHAKCQRKQNQLTAAKNTCDRALEYNHQLWPALKEKDTIQAILNNQPL